MLRRLFALSVVALVLVLIPSQAHGTETITIKDKIEVSGMAADSARGVYWITDESGGKLTAIDKSGKTLGKVTYTARTQSVQALSLSRGSMWIGDLGGDRRTLRLLHIRSLKYGTAPADSFELAMPRGHKGVKALMVSPKGNVYLVADGEKPGIYRANAPLSARSVNELTRVADAPNGVTDGVFTSDGKSVILRTSEQVEVFDAYQWNKTASASLPTGQDKGQALGLSLDGRSLVLSNGATLTSAEVPTTIDESRSTPSASVSPGSSTNSGNEEPSSGGSPTPAAKPSLTGTYTALGAALGISLIAALIVVVKR